MDKETFSYLVSSPEDISIAEVRNLETLAEQFPYCQLTYSLVAKGYHIHFSESQYSNKIREAAAHALSRNALRKLINGTFTNQRTAAAIVSPYRSEYAFKKPAFVEKVEDKVAPIIEDVIQTSATIPSPIEPVENQELIAEIQPIEESISIESAFEKPIIEAVLPIETPIVVEELKPIESVVEEICVKEFEEVEPHIFEFKDEAFAITPEPIAAIAEPIIAEIPAQAVEIQTKIIDKFIQTDPGRIVMKKTAEENENIDDLAERSSAKPKALNLVTESFAKIMTMQGRYDKAIEIYKKLILKFPEKSAYFASKIDEISK